MGVVTSSHIKGLEDSFENFSELTQSLETTYQSLEESVNQLQLQLVLAQQSPTSQSQSQQSDDLASDTQKTLDTESRLKLLSGVIKVLPAGVLVLDTTGRVQECNLSAESLLGVPLRGELWRDVVKRCFAPQDDDGHEISLRDGRRVNISTCPLGEEPGQVLLLTDVTETRRLQERLSQQKRLAALGEMAASLAHQIRTPLSAAVLAVSQIKNSKLSQHNRQVAVEKLLTNMRQLESMVNDMLLFSRSGYVDQEPFTIESLMNSLGTAIHSHTHPRALNCKIVNEAGDISIVGNLKILHSALLNLVNNALEEIDESGHVVIHAVSNEMNTVDITIKDSGCGVPVELKEKIFEPFFTTRSNGTGLGLAVVRAIARAHCGEVWLEQTQEAGSTFVMRLPAT